MESIDYRKTWQRNVDFIGGSNLYPDGHFEFDGRIFKCGGASSVLERTKQNEWRYTVVARLITNVLEDTFGDSYVKKPTVLNYCI